VVIYKMTIASKLTDFLFLAHPLESVYLNVH